MRVMIDTNVLLSAVIFRSSNSVGVIVDAADVFATGDKDFDDVTVSSPSIVTSSEYMSIFAR